MLETLVATVAGIVYILLFLAGVPLLMFKSAYFVAVLPVMYLVASWPLQFWRWIARQHVPMLCLLALFHAISLLSFQLFNAPAHELMMIPLMLIAMGMGVIFALTSSRLGCSAPAAYGPTISYAAGNIYWIGYVFMFVVLTLLPVLFVYRLQRLKVNAGRVNRPSLLLIIWGFASATFTGIYPWTAPMFRCEHTTLFGEFKAPCGGFTEHFHMIGFIGGLLMCAVGSSMLLHRVVSPHRDQFFGLRSEPFSMTLASVNRKAIYFYACLILVLIVFMVCLFDEFAMYVALVQEVDKWEICINYLRKDECLGAAVPAGLNYNKTWPCQWNDSVPELDVLHQCTNPTCFEHGRLDMSAAAITCEYFAICCWNYIVLLTVLVCERIEEFVDNPEEEVDKESAPLRAELTENARAPDSTDGG